MQNGPSLTSINAPQTIVVGMGPAGLAATLNLLLVGHRVILIDKRIEYSLKQKVLLPQKIVSMLSQLAEQFNYGFSYISKLKNLHGLTSLRKFSKFQLNILGKIVEAGQLNINGSEVTIASKLLVLRDPGSEITSINGDAQTVTLKNGFIISFNHIIDASGTSRVVARALSQSSSQYEMPYSSNILQPTHRENAIICLYVREDIQVNDLRMDYAHDRTDKFELMQTYRSLGWKKEAPPKYYLLSSSEKNKIYMLTEIPAKIYDENRIVDLLEFAHLRFKSLDIYDIDEFNTSDFLLKFYSMFTLNIEIAERPFIKLGQEGLAVLIGDAFMTSNFHYGHGVTKAIDDGNNLSLVFNGDQYHTMPLFKRALKVRKEVEDFERKQPTQMSKDHTYRTSQR